MIIYAGRYKPHMEIWSNAAGPLETEAGNGSIDQPIPAHINWTVGPMGSDNVIPNMIREKEANVIFNIPNLSKCQILKT